MDYGATKMTLEEFITHYCEPGMTGVQRYMTDYMIKRGRVIGVARAVGRSVYWPLVSCGKQQPNVIDTAGYFQLASQYGMMLYDTEQSE